MSSHGDAIARRAAARLAPKISPKLPAYVERTLAGGEAAGDEVPQRSPEPALVLAFVGLIVTLAKNTWDVYRETSKPKGDTLSPGEIALLRELLTHRIRQGARFPDDAAIEVRDALIEAVVEETVAEAKQLEAKRPDE